MHQSAKLNARIVQHICTKAASCRRLSFCRRLHGDRRQQSSGREIHAAELVVVLQALSLRGVRSLSCAVSCWRLVGPAARRGGASTATAFGREIYATGLKLRCE